MDGLKIVPQLFFDLIGRVVPGAVAIIGYLRLRHETWQGWLMTGHLGQALAESPAASAAILIASAYIVGQVLRRQQKACSAWGKRGLAPG